MDRQRISVDDLLARQGELRSGIRATIKPEGEDRVTVSPVVAGGSCACPHKITVNKKDIADLVPTDDVSNCCGEKLIVVEVNFANETVADIFRQLSEAAAESLKSRPIPAFSHGRPPPPPWLRGDFVADFQACCDYCNSYPVSAEDQIRCLNRCFLVHIAS